MYIYYIYIYYLYNIIYGNLNVALCIVCILVLIFFFLTAREETSSFQL